MLHPKAMSPPGGALRFVSWNVKGLNSPFKRKKIIGHLQQLNTRIAFIQETHLKLSDHLKLRFGWVGQIYHSSFNSKARGVAILVHKNVPLSVTNVISDPNGRFIIVSGKISGNGIVLVNVYGPNWDNEDFFKKLFFSLPDLNGSQLIIGGDFNCCLDPLLDRSSNKPHHLSKSSKAIHMFMEQYKVSDVWRYFNPDAKQFSFFSPVHGTFSRIDFFLVDNNLLPIVNACSYTPIVISDHAPVLLDISLSGSPLSRSPWRFNSLLLSDTDFVKFMNERIDLYISTNATPDVTASTIWEACKAFLRGEIIAYTANKNKIASQKSQALYNSISELQIKCAQSPSDDLTKELLLKKSEFDSMSTNTAVNAIRRTQYSYYEFGDKPSKVLAHQIRQASTAQHITEIFADNAISINPQTINNQFLHFYSSLYTSESLFDESDYERFFNGFTIPTIESSVVAELDRPFTVGEIKSAVMSMQSGKSPGPDGLPSEFYKVFIDKLSPLMLNMLKESSDVGVLPLSLRQATISFILKKDKDPRFCCNYRPISLLCADVKIVAKMLAKRLESIMSTIINPDQTGFIKSRHSYHNIRRLLNILYSSSSTNTPEMVISMDAEKAFDRVEWPYLFYTLKRFGFGSKYISWVKLLYSLPLARVRTNNDYSKYFSLGRGTRQGCPLSPLLFAIAIEPLAAALRASSMQGISRAGSVHKVCLYADDLLLFVSDPDISIPPVLSILKVFGQISGYKLNFDKSEIFPVNPIATTYPLDNLPFKPALQSFKYLGIHITKEFSDLFKTNFNPVLEKLTQDMHRWSMLPLSLAGRISCIKMNVLPKFLYLFQCIPVFIPKKFFQSLDASISQFLWNKKPPRIRKTVLQKIKESGGLALPNFLYYYWSVNVRTMLFWCSNGNKPNWLSMEEASCDSASLCSLLCLPLKSSPIMYSNNIIVKNCLKIWAQVKQHFVMLRIPLISPFDLNPLFPPSLIDKTFAMWRSHGLVSVKDFYVDGVLASFAQLSSKFNLPNTHFFRFLQARDFINKHFPGSPTIPDVTMIDTILEVGPLLRGAISKLYNNFLSKFSESSDRLRLAWSEELMVEINSEEWQSILKRVHSSSICARHCIIQCKVVHRVHWSRSRLARIFPGTDSNCAKCNLGPANLTHMFLTCPALSLFWDLVFDSLSAISSVRLPKSPLTALFGILPAGHSLPSHFVELIAYFTLLARRAILMRWKDAHPPTHSQWIKDALYFMKLEKIKYSLRGSDDKFLKVWLPFQDHVLSLQLVATP